MRDPPYWRTERIWRDDVVAVLGGGPSLTTAAVATVRAAGVRTIAINNAAIDVAPWADLLYACDSQWWGWHAKSPVLEQWRERCERGDAIAATLENGPMRRRLRWVRGLRNGGKNGFDDRPDTLRHGGNGGYQAIHLAAHLGASRILLLGFDMRVVDGRSHYHRGHPVRTRPGLYAQLMIPSFETLAPELTTRGVQVLNCSLGSALRAFPAAVLEDALRSRISQQHALTL